MASCAAGLPDLRAAHAPIFWPYTSLVSTFAHEGIHRGGSKRYILDSITRPS